MMKKRIAAIFIACMLVVSACSNTQAEEETNPSAPGADTPGGLSGFETYSLDDITINAPASWTMKEETAPGGYRAEVRDYNVDPVQWQHVSVYTSLSVVVVNEERSFQNLTAQEYIDKRYDDLSIDVTDKEKELLIIDGVEAGMVTQKRPYLDYYLTSIFIPYNGKEYNIDIHYDGSDAEIVDIANKIIAGIAIAG